MFSIGVTSRWGSLLISPWRTTRHLPAKLVNCSRQDVPQVEFQVDPGAFSTVPHCHKVGSLGQLSSNVVNEGLSIRRWSIVCMHN